MTEELHFDFTLKKLQALPAPAKGRKEYHDTGCPFLTLIVTHTGTKTFYRYGRVDGKPQRDRIATFPAFTVKNARDACAILTGKIAQGDNPAAERQEKRKEKTLGELWEWYLEFHAKPHKRTWERDEKIWNRDLKHLARRRLSTITRPDIVELCQNVTTMHNPGSGRKVVELISSMFSQAIVNEWIDRNPAHKVKKPPKNERTRFLLPSEMERFFTELAKLQTRSRDFLLLCLFTGARRENVLSMRWEEINWDSLTWIIPKDKAKSKRDINLPLAELAIEVLKERKATTGESQWVFPSSVSQTGHYAEPKFSWTTLLIRAKLEDLRIHDLRRTLGSWQAGAGVSLQIIGKSLGHGSLRSTEIYARLQTDPVREAVNNATQAIKKASGKTTEPKKRKDS